MANSDFSRRDFLKSTAIAALSGTVLHGNEGEARSNDPVSAPPLVLPPPLALPERSAELRWLEAREGLGRDAVNVTHRFHYIGDDNYKFLLVILFGGPEVVFELLDLIDVPEWTRAWTEFCELYNADKAEQKLRAGRAMDTPFPVWGARFSAFAAQQKKDPVLARRAWQEFLHGFHHDEIARYPLQFQMSPGTETLNPGDELPLGETNHAVQWSPNAIELLAFVGDALPENPGAPWQ